MGGASRNERKRRQEAADKRLAAAGITPPRKAGGPNRTALIVVAAVVAVVAVIGLTITLNQGTEPVAANYPVSVSGTVITAGQPGAPLTVDVYEDYLCAGCERFEARYRDEITTALNDGQITVNYHPVAILVAETDPPGYSTLAANAAVCSVPAGIFPAFHTRLFADQPAVGGPGLTAAELVAIGAEAGAGAGFEQCVSANGNAAAIASGTEAAATTPALQTDGQFGTPTIAVGGQKVDVNESSWLQDAIGP